MNRLYFTKIFLATALTSTMFLSPINAMEAKAPIFSQETLENINVKIEKQTPDQAGAAKRYPIGYYSIKMTNNMIEKLDKDKNYQPTEAELDSFFICYTVFKRLLASDYPKNTVAKNKDGYEIVMEKNKDGAFRIETNARFDRAHGILIGYESPTVTQSINMDQLARAYRKLKYLPSQAVNTTEEVMADKVIASPSHESLVLKNIKSEIENQAPDQDGIAKRYPIGYYSIKMTNDMIKKMNIDKEYQPTNDELNSFFICYTVSQRLVASDYPKDTVAKNKDGNEIVMEKSRDGIFKISTNVRFNRVNGILKGYQTGPNHFMIEAQLNINELDRVYSQLNQLFSKNVTPNKSLKEGKLVLRKGMNSSGTEQISLLFIKQKTPEGKVMYAAINPNSPNNMEVQKSFEKLVEAKVEGLKAKDIIPQGKFINSKLMTKKVIFEETGEKITFNGYDYKVAKVIDIQ